MDFFEAQERARRRTKWLVLLFALAVVGTTLAGYFAAIVATRQLPATARERAAYSAYPRPAARPGWAHWWDPRLFLYVAGGTVAVVALASLFKWSQLRRGGSAVAELVGGRAVNPKTTDLNERRLLNVVEEMAIASGIPMPAVYVLEDEPGLNAFAAGLTTSDAAVAVTRGTLDKLSRDELQGVIGHEFSHILNGDMRLNVRITAVVFGILVIGLIGRGLLRALLRGRVRSNGKNKGGAAVVVVSVGLALLIIGYVGYFFGRLIQAAVSRQREFLADASAVQFTRNPSGITGALRKIGGYALGGNITNQHAAELGHFFFTQAFRSYFGGLWATHPPLPERIRAIDPQWDGQLFTPPAVVDVKHETFADAGFGGARLAPDETLRRVHAAPANLPPVIPVQPLPFKPAAVVADIGALTEGHFRHAQDLLAAIPGPLRDAAHDTALAPVLVYGLLLGSGRTERDRQQEIVSRHAGPGESAALQALRPALSLLEPAARLPLLQLAMPALRRLDRAQLERFVGTLDELVHADQRVTPFEYALQKMLLRQLDLARQPAGRGLVTSPASVGREIAVVLSALARLNAREEAAAARAFAAGTARLPAALHDLALAGAAESGLEQLDAALDRLASASLPLKKDLLVAAAHVVGGDGTVSVEEGELYRALAATLDCPMPNLALAG
ncbi:MAG: M48 family metallopeptidase [Opitutaceae bacterium]|nr:M48 family metallopeptidase [Opitutaceae bacterium]